MRTCSASNKDLFIQNFQRRLKAVLKLFSMRKFALAFRGLGRLVQFDYQTPSQPIMKKLPLNITGCGVRHPEIHVGTF